MGATPVFALPYPEPTDPADVPTDMHELCDAIEALRPMGGPTAAKWKMIGGSTSTTTNASAQVTIPYGVTVGSAFLVVCNGDATAGADMIVAILTQTTTGFTVTVFRGATPAANANVRINWIALVT